MVTVSRASPRRIPPVSAENQPVKVNPSRTGVSAKVIAGESTVYVESETVLPPCSS